MNTFRLRRQQGFSMIELAVVIVIIGLLIGAIIMGRTMIRQSELRNIATEYNLYTGAIEEFKNKYQAMPGDFSAATSNWSTGGGMTVANGDGSGTVGTSTTGGVPSGSSEWYQAWTHMALAGLVPGRFTGADGGSGAEPGSNVPSSKVTPGGWTLLFFLNTSTSASFWSGKYGHILTFGAKNTGTYTSGGIVTPVEMSAIDQKMDDGKPALGKLRSARSGAAANCTDNSASVAAAAYNSSSSTYKDQRVCWLMFIPGI